MFRERPHANGKRDWVRAHGQAADRGYFRAAARNLLLDQLEHHFPDEMRAFRVERCEPAIDVVGASLAGRQDEVSVKDGFFLQQPE